MTTDAADTADTGQLRKFQALLRELFQFDCADLDFGIYRIMNHKRDVVERFVSENLPAAVAAELDTGALRDQGQAATRLADLERQVRKVLGPDAIGPDGELAEVYRQSKIGQDYLEARAATSGGTDRAAAEAAIYNHLHTFFSRYYEDGDFISKRRYGRTQRYAIPYNGEEVYLHWANSDQYYVKTEENFRDYDWNAPNGVAVRFRLADANIEQNNVKGDKRFFVPRARETRYDADARAVTIPFEYRPLNGAESTRYRNRNQQDNIIKEAVCAIPKRLEAHTEAVDALTGEHRRGEGAVSRLRHHLLRYTRKNDSDFFIHKALSGFLTRELDFYLKNEVLNIDDLVAAGERLAEGRFQQMRLIKSIGGKIIDFLAQIEDFQKRLWEKRKFVTDVQYCVTLANVNAAFHDEIVSNDAQWAEWRDLLGVDDSQRNTAFLRDNPTLPLDTAHFGAAFTDRLLASFDDLDGMTDGLLVHSENWQALRLLEEKYRGKVRMIYIDPPFNTTSGDFFYKDGYPHSSWLTMMESRIQIVQSLLATDGTLYAHIDYTEKELLKGLLDKYLTYVTEIIWRIGWVSGYKAAAKKFIRNHDTIYQYGKTESPYFNKTYIPYPEGYTRRDGSPPTGQGYPLEDTWNSSDLDRLNSIQIVSFSREKVGNQALTQKNESLVARMVTASSKPGDVVLDHFLGSGTTTATAHKMGRQYIGVEVGDQFFTYLLPRMKRVLHGDPYGISSTLGWKGGGMFKYMRVESYEDALDGIQFDEKLGRMALEERLGEEYLLKYVLKFETKQSRTLLNVMDLDAPFDYRLRARANGSDRELNANVAETFNYLLGLNVRTRRVYDDNGRRYLVYRGETRESPGRVVVVIWRDTRGWSVEDAERDRRFVKEQGLADGADDVYVNAPCIQKGAKPVEPLFHARMFAGASPLS